MSNRNNNNNNNVPGFKPRTRAFEQLARNPAPADDRPVSRNDVTARLIEAAHAASGPKSSDQFVQGAQRVLDAALDSGQLTIDHLLIMTEICKKLPLNAVQADEVFTQGLRKQEQKSGALLEQFKKSIPTKRRAELLPIVKEIANILHHFAETEGVDNRSFSWGTIARTSHFRDLGIDLIGAFNTYVIPPGKKFMHSTLPYNVVDFDQAYDVISWRWACILTLLRGMAPNVWWLQQGEIIPGTNARSSNGQWVLHSRVLKEIQAKFNPAAEVLVVGGVTTFDVEKSKGDLQALLAASVPIDIRLLLQTSDFKQFRSEESKTKVKDLMMEVIQTIGVDFVYTDVLDLNSGSDFSDAYYRAANIVKATIRGFNAQIYGRRGGADTRTNRLKVSAGPKKTVTALKKTPGSLPGGKE